MRLPEKQVKTGYFWLPGQPEGKVPGTLTIKDGGASELEIVGLFGDGIRTKERLDEFSRLVGHIEDFGLVTLEDCFYTRKNFALSGSISKSLLCVNQVIAGVAYDKDEPVTFHYVSFSIEGLDEWLGLTGISVAYSQDYRSATINYTPIAETSYCLPDGFELRIRFSYSLPGASKITEAKISQKAFLQIKSEHARSLDEFIGLAHKITTLLCFAMDATVSICDVSANSEDIQMDLGEGRKRPVEMKLFYTSLPFSEKLPNIDRHRMLFTYPQIQSKAEAVVNNWLGAYSTIRPALGLYFSAAAGTHKYLDGKFLALAQGLETYHRRTSNETLKDRSTFRKLVAELLWKCPKMERKWLRGRLIHGNEINLGKRIKKIIEPFKSHLGNTKERTKLIRNIVDTRNYLTHYSEALESGAVRGGALWALCQRMEVIFQLHLLQQLGFSVPEINAILVDNYRLKQKLA